MYVSAAEVPNPWPGDSHAGSGSTTVLADVATAADYERRRVTVYRDGRVPGYDGRLPDPFPRKTHHVILPRHWPDAEILSRTSATPGTVAVVERPDGTLRTYVSGYLTDDDTVRKGPKRVESWRHFGRRISRTVYFRRVEPEAPRTTWDDPLPYDVWRLPT